MKKQGIPWKTRTIGSLQASHGSYQLLYLNCDKETRKKRWSKYHMINILARFYGVGFTRLIINVNKLRTSWISSLTKQLELPFFLGLKSDDYKDVAYQCAQNGVITQIRQKLQASLQHPPSPTSLIIS